MLALPRNRSFFAVFLSVFALAAVACGDDSASSPGGGDAGGGGDTGAAGEAGAGGGGGGSKAGAAGASAGGGGQAGAAGEATGGSSAAGSAGTASGGQAGEAGAGSAGASAAGAAGASGAAGAAGAAGGGATTVQEMEPNGGAKTDEINAYALGTVVAGAIGTPKDADIFKLDATPGKVYAVHLQPAAGSALVPHLAVFDAGRNGKTPGDDYTKIGLGGNGKGAEALVEALAMGEGGYFLAVRDARNVDGGGAFGGDGFGYTLTVEELDASARIVGPLALPGTVDQALAAPGAVQLFSFTAPAGMTLTASFTPKNKSLDGRFFVFSTVTNDWAARNDDAAPGDPSPGFDAVPVTPAGDCYLVVENLEPSATALGYKLTSGTP